MSSVLENKPVAQDNLAEKLNFSKSLQAVTNRILQPGARARDRVQAFVPEHACG